MSQHKGAKGPIRTAPSNDTTYDHVFLDGKPMQIAPTKRLPWAVKNMGREWA